MSGADTSVVIVGAGPVGLGLAVALGRLGVRCTVLEQGSGTDQLHPTANHLGTRQMEVLRSWGLDDRILAAGYPPDRPDRRYWMDRLDGRVLYEIERHAGGEPPDLAYSPTHEMWISKGTFDPILLEAARSAPTIDVRFSSAVQDVHQDPSGVVVTVGGTNGTRQLTADYLVGCDGAASGVRQSLGIDTIGPIRPGIVLQSVWFRAPELTDLLPPDGLHYALVDPGGMLVVLDRPGVYRIHVPTFGESAPQPMTNDEGVELVRRAAGRPDLEVDVYSCGAWELSVSLATQWRRGRVFLAGDAAKAGTPFGGLGMGYGLLDAHNLAWKLAAALDGWGGDGLLDSYEAERRPAAARLLAYQGARLDVDPPYLDSRLVPPFPDPAVLADGPDGDGARAEYRDALAAHNEGHYDNVGIDVDQRYVDSPVVVGDGTDEPPWEERSYEPRVRAGHRFPHAWIESGRSTIDLFGSGFVLVAAGVFAKTAPLVQAAAEVGLPLAVHGLPAATQSAVGCPALTLVRPDGHVAWCGDDVPADTTALIGAIRGDVRGSHQ